MRPYIAHPKLWRRGNPQSPRKFGRSRALSGPAAGGPVCSFAMGDTGSGHCFLPRHFPPWNVSVAAFTSITNLCSDENTLFAAHDMGNTPNPSGQKSLRDDREKDVPSLELLQR